MLIPVLGRFSTLLKLSKTSSELLCFKCMGRIYPLLSLIKGTYSFDYDNYITIQTWYFQTE